jgi:hypothetical protein
MLAPTTSHKTIRLAVTQKTLFLERSLNTGRKRVIVLRGCQADETKAPALWIERIN